MSSVNLTGATKGLYQYLQNLSADNTNASGTTNSSSISTLIGTLSQQLGASHRPRHHGASFMQKIQQAVTSALQSSKNGQPSDPNQIIQNTISQILNGSSSTEGDTGDDAQQSIIPSDGAGAPGANSAATFLQTLQSFGVTPGQFRQDFLSALQNVAPSASTGLTSVPPGLTVDTLG